MSSLRWLPFLAVALIGTAIGIGAFTFVYAEGHSYLSDDPAACANCHVMEEQYSAWMKSSHSSVAVCNDCHTPHDLIGKYTIKARNGFWHSFYFTTGTFPDPIRIRDYNRNVVEVACRDCHQAISSSLVHGDVPPAFSGETMTAAEAVSCTSCHSDVGHWTR